MCLLLNDIEKSEKRDFGLSLDLPTFYEFTEPKFKPNSIFSQ
jgi:hypothetical protein